MVREALGGATPSLEGVFGVFLVLFVVIPTLELWSILKVGQAIGAPETLLALIVLSTIGAWLCKQQGLTVLRRIQDALDTGRLPTRELQDGAMILVAGALLLTPGFLGDVVGILLLLPPVRAALRPLLARFLRRRIQVATIAGAGAGAGGSWGGPVVDVDARPAGRDERDGPSGPIALGP